MESNKPRVVKSFENLSEELQEQIKLAYPEGFAQNLIKYKNAAGESVSALIFETDERVYLVKMTITQAHAIIEDDEDYNADGQLKQAAQEEYEDKYGDLDYMSDYLEDSDDEDTEEEDDSDMDDFR